MCGLTAVLNSESTIVTGLDKFITDAAVTTQLRGMDSTGMYQVDGNLELLSYKKAVDGTTFVQLPRAADMLNDADTAYVTVVHNRKATTGKINDTNAHPFVHEDEQGDADFALVHNGTITAWDSRRFNTDTAALASKVNEEGPQALDDLRGAWSVIWTDMATQVTYMATNGERPLHYAFLKDKSVVLICSEAGMLSWLAERNKLELEDNAIYEADLHQTYAFPLSDVRDFTKTPIRQVTPWQSQTNTASVYDTRRDAILKAAKTLEEQARNGTLTADSALTTVTPLTSRNPKHTPVITKEERDALFAWTGEHEFVAVGTPIYKDGSNNIVYLDPVTDGNPYAHVNRNDAILIKCTSASQAANVMRYHSIELTIHGMDSEGYFVAAPPTPGQLHRGILSTLGNRAVVEDLPY